MFIQISIILFLVQFLPGFPDLHHLNVVSEKEELAKSTIGRQSRGKMFLNRPFIDVTSSEVGIFSVEQGKFYS
jgi:hypothetical protein